MWMLLALLFTLRTGTIPSLAAPASLSLRAESREAALHGGRVEPYTRDLAEPSPLVSAPQVPEFPSWAGPGPGPGPVFTPYRPEEWVARVASHLNLTDHRLTNAALWLAASPVRVDLTSTRVHLTLTLRAP